MAVVNRSGHIVVVVEENHSAETILGAADLAHFNQLERSGTVLQRYFAVSHPSLPNYLALVSGSTHGFHDDCGTCSITGPNLGEQLQQAGISWKVYAQGLPKQCAHAAVRGAYTRRHVALLYFASIRSSQALCSHIVSYDQFSIDVKSGQLPTFAMVIPDVDHDMHGRTEQQDDPQARVRADAFIGSLYDLLSSSSAWQADTRLVITWDEGGGVSPPPHGCCGGDANGGHVATIVVGPQVPVGSDRTAYDHYSLLRSIESRYGLAHLGAAAHAASHDIPSIVG